MRDTPKVLTRREGAVLVITNCNPAQRNALSPEFFEGAAQALTAAERDAGIGAVVLTGEGNFFCAGGDLNSLAQRRQMTPEARRERLERLHGLVRRMRDTDKPVIAAVEGGAAGAGLSIALACDLLVAARNARFSISYAKVGLTPDGGITASLSEFMARQRMTELCLSGESFDALELHARGAINRLVDPGQALAAAIELGERLARGPLRSMAAIKALCHAAYERTLDAQLDAEREAMVLSQADAESAEGIAAFLAKRRADFERLRAEASS